MEYVEQVQQFINFLEARPECNKKCSVIANVKSISHEINNNTYMKDGTPTLLVILCVTLHSKSVNYLISILKENHKYEL
jgi:hypothetical protein